MPSRNARRASATTAAGRRGLARARSAVRRRVPGPVREGLRRARRRIPVRLLKAVYAVSARIGVGDALVFPARPAVEPARVRLLVAPANFAGQGSAWAQAAARHLDGVSGQSFAVVKGKMDFPADYGVPTRTYRHLVWQVEQERQVTKSYTHVLIEAERPVLGTLYGSVYTGELPVLRRAGITVGLIAHGSDVRIPSQHAATYAWSPFRSAEWGVIPTLESNATRNAALLNGYDGYVFVSTPDLLAYVPGATWCPVVVDCDRWATELPVLERSVPVVVHAPSSSRMKGSELIDPVVQRLADAGLIEYRRITDASPASMPAIYQSADVVLDQFCLGSYGVASCEGMAAGRVVVGYVTDAVRRHVRAVTGLELPIIEATPGTIEEVLLRLLEDRDQARTIADEAKAFVGEVHDGRLSARALAPFLGAGQRA